TIHISWHPPKPGMYKLNIDGAFDPNTHRGGVGGVFRYSIGDWLGGYCKPLYFTNVLQAELLALYYGLSFAINRSLTPLIVEIDSQILIALLPSGNHKYLHIFNACRLMLYELHMPIIQHTFKEGNGVADALACFGRDMQITQPQDVMLFENPPPFMLTHSFLDSAGTATACSVPSL
ncbi:putative ribonuclease h protein, partial [Nicotiana attenuata]